MFPGLYKSFDKYLLVHLLTQHDDTVRIKAYHADVTKKKSTWITNVKPRVGVPPAPSAPSRGPSVGAQPLSEQIFALGGSDRRPRTPS